MLRRERSDVATRGREVLLYLGSAAVAWRTTGCARQPSTPRLHAQRRTRDTKAWSAGSVDQRTASDACCKSVASRRAHRENAAEPSLCVLCVLSGCIPVGNQGFVMVVSSSSHGGIGTHFSESTQRFHGPKAVPVASLDGCPSIF